MRRNYTIKHNHTDNRACGKSIHSFKVGTTKISFFDSDNNLITEIPTLPEYSGSDYRNRLYKKTESRQFDDPPKISNVLPNSFNFKYEHISCTVNHDGLLQQEQNQIKIDIEAAYRAFKEKFCLQDNNANKDIKVYIFNNRDDFVKYNNLLGLDHDGKTVADIQYITRGVTDNCEKILTYKQASMDFVLGHELGHILQWNFSPAKKIQDLHYHYKGTEFIANFIGREVEKENYNFSTTGHRSTELNKVESTHLQTNSTEQSGSFSNFIFSAIELIVGSITSLFSWVFGFANEKSVQQSEFNLEVDELDHDFEENCINNYHASDDYNHYNSPDGLL